VQWGACQGHLSDRSEGKGQHFLTLAPVRTMNKVTKALLMK
jgi:hypothetical protein